jgi:hypothetical protein
MSAYNLYHGIGFNVVLQFGHRVILGLVRLFPHWLHEYLRARMLPQMNMSSPAIRLKGNMKKKKNTIMPNTWIRLPDVLFHFTIIFGCFTVYNNNFFLIVKGV